MGVVEWRGTNPTLIGVGQGSVIDRWDSALLWPMNRVPGGPNYTMACAIPTSQTPFFVP